jgi:hypothetical protein
VHSLPQVLPTKEATRQPNRYDPLWSKEFPMSILRQSFCIGERSQPTYARGHLGTSGVQCTHFGTRYGALRTFSRHLNRKVGQACNAAQAEPIPVLDLPTALRPVRPFIHSRTAIDLRTRGVATPSEGLELETSLPHQLTASEYVADDCDEEFLSPSIAELAGPLRRPRPDVRGPSN